MYWFNWVRPVVNILSNFKSAEMNGYAFELQSNSRTFSAIKLSRVDINVSFNCSTYVCVQIVANSFFF